MQLHGVAIGELNCVFKGDFSPLSIHTVVSWGLQHAPSVADILEVLLERGGEIEVGKAGSIVPDWSGFDEKRQPERIWFELAS